MKISWREVSGYLLIVVASCFWGGSASLGKSLFQAGMSTAQLMQVRSVMSAVVITVILALFRRKHFRIQPRDLWGLLLLAIPGLVVVNASYYQAVKMLPNNQIGNVFEATVEATEEAIINGLIAAETMTGVDDHKVIALPHDRLKEILKKYNRLN